MKLIKNNLTLIIISVIHWIISFFTDHIVFSALPGNGIVSDIVSLEKDERINYLLCKIILFIVIFCFWKMISRCIKAIKEKDSVFNTLKYSLIYLIPIAFVLIFKLPQGFLSNDEALIFEEASSLATYTWFYYLTTYYYIVCMMLIPSWTGPIIVKVFIQVAVCGYVVSKMYDRLQSKVAYIMYIPFLMFPVLAYTTSAHRIPVYYLLYLLMMFVIYTDSESSINSKGEIIWIMICGAVLTQWRTEGIYLVGIVPILLFLSYKQFYRGENARKNILITLVAFMLIQYLVSVPQNGFSADRLGDKAINRMGPFWAYSITNMYRNGLDFEKNKADMEKVWRYLDKDTLQAINDDLGDINYEDVLALYYEGYVCTKEGVENDDYIAYVEGCKNIFINNPDVFLKTRIGAFKYAAVPYHIGTDSAGIKGVIKLLFSIFKGFSYNLFIPCIIVLVFWVISLIKRRWIEFFVMSGLICHWFIVFILAPASYFKYYLPIYLMAYFWVVLKITESFHFERKMV